MHATYRDLLKHSGIYGVGQVLSRMVSVLLLPVYTRYLVPADYGSIAILDVTVSLLSIVLVSGTVRAVNRYHFESNDEADRDRLWWTSIALLVATAAVIVVPIFLLRGRLAGLTLGPSEALGSYYFSIALPTLCLTAFEQLLQTHLRVYKLSGLSVGVSLGRLLLNVALNLTLLIHFHLGVAGVLWGNLLAAAASVATLFVFFLRQRGAPRLEPSLVGPLASYGGPLIVTTLLSLGMHQADRYLLRIFLDLDQVGLYSVAYTLGQGINTLVLMPFSQIWQVAIYEIAPSPDAKRIYVRVFEHFFNALLLLMLGVSLFARPIVALLTAPEYRSAAGLIPIVCLAYVFFSLNAHFNVPVLLAKRTLRMIPPNAAALAVNIGANLLLIPRLGTLGAAWSSVLTFAVFSFGGLLVYRQIDRYDYPFRRFAAVLGGVVVSFVAWQRLTPWSEGPLAASLLGAAVWVGWAAILAGPPLYQLWKRFVEARRERPARSDEAGGTDGDALLSRKVSG